MTSEIASAGNTGAALVTGAVKRASQSTGAHFDFLMKMAARESGFDPNAKAKTSSAAGLFQFIEQTWLATVKKYGAGHGLGDVAAKITRNANGRYAVADPAERQAVLNLRFDADKASAMAGELANENKRALESRLGRAVTSADLYTAHFLGPAGAVKLLSAAASTKAADLLPRAAAANKPVFYDGARAKTVGEVVASIAKSMGETAKVISTAQNTNASETKSFAPVAAYKSFIADTFSAPARAVVSSGGGLSAMALGVIDALDATLMRDDRNSDREDRF
ncbi:transglycosylase SLT domain-containing protein [Hyphococcus flavus]|uniref:Transglycosylase SLT domain-containing protein n=1 Tax=Hyphococcus flavus TaxID=1866326 RepID=A0AAE9ZC66_9PROT|nr:transglycosylase SLT domain-containing protein [Hyphococcus flavus]WDI32029.1 transglycosylase SLT domain-containing protein [Hyphococcus flavus]